MTGELGKVTILLVDDDSIDRKAVKRAFRQRNIANEIVEAQDGQEGLDILHGCHPEKRIDPPYLILLDLSMPRMDGIEFLDRLRSDEVLVRSIVFVLTTSASDEDRRAAYDQNVAGYIVKSSLVDEFWRVVDMIDRYWRVVELP